MARRIRWAGTRQLRNLARTRRLYHQSTDFQGRRQPPPSAKGTFSIRERALNKADPAAGVKGQRPIPGPPCSAESAVQNSGTSKHWPPRCRRRNRSALAENSRNTGECHLDRRLGGVWLRHHLLVAALYLLPKRRRRRPLEGLPDRSRSRGLLRGSGISEGGGAAAGAPANTLWPPAQGLRDISDPVTLPAAAATAALAPAPPPPPGDGDVSAAAAAAAGGRGAAGDLTLRPPAQGYQSRARRAGKRF